MTKFFNVFLLNLLILSGRYQSGAVFLKPSTLDKLNFEIEDSESNQFENLPKPLRSYSEGPEEFAKTKRHYHEKLSDPFALIPTWNVDSNSPGGVGDSFSVGRDYPKDLSEWHYGPLDVSSITAKMKKWNLAENTRLRRNPDWYRRPVRFLDYTNSQMPFNEGKLQRKNIQGKPSEVSKKSFHSKDSQDPENPEREPRSKRSGKSIRRRRFFEVPCRSRNYPEIPLDDPLLEYLDHKRAKKQIGVTSTLEAKEAAMSRVLDPNLNSDGILEPHVRKRRELHLKKCAYTAIRDPQNAWQKPSEDSFDSRRQNSFEY